LGRPIGVTILGVLVIVGGVLFLLLGLLALAGAFLLFLLPGQEPLTGLALLLGLVALVLGILLIVSGSGLMKLRPWAWWLAVLVLVVSLVNTAYGYYIGSATAAQSAASAILPFLLLVYLLAVRKHFKPQPTLGQYAPR